MSARSPERRGGFRSQRRLQGQPDPRLAPGLVPRGRPSRHLRAQLALQAGELATAWLRSRHPDVNPPIDPEAACYLYLKTVDQATCASGCGTPVAGRARNAAPSHRTRAYRQRQTRSTSRHKSEGARAIGLRGFEMAINRIDWIAESAIVEPGYVGCSSEPDEQAGTSGSGTAGPTGPGSRRLRHGLTFAVTTAPTRAPATG
jgi:hypothetical protein